MKKALIVSYTFPPTGGAGVQRISKFVKYLRDFNYEPVVFTVANPSVPLVDNSLLKDIPSDVAVYKAKTYEPSYDAKRKVVEGSGNGKSSFLKNLARNILLPDPQILWWPSIFLNLGKIIKKERIKCIFVSAPPYSILVPVTFIGCIMKIPVIVDFRDEWIFSRSQLENMSRNRFASVLDSFLERYVVIKCSAITVASERYAASILTRYPGIDRNKIVTITNGYDEEDFKKFDMLNKIGSDKIKIVYTGTVWKATSLRPFIEAVSRIIENNPSVKNALNIKIIGRVVDSEMEYLKSDTLFNIVEVVGYLDHKDAIDELNSADILLLTLSDLEGALKIIPGKTFEYMAAGKHIFAIVPFGETETIIRKFYKNSTLAHPKEGDIIASSLDGILTNIDSIRKQTSIDVSQFSRRTLAKKLVEVLDSVS